MSLGRRQDEQKPIWVATQELPRSAGHPFYARLEGLLREAEFDPRGAGQIRPVGGGSNPASPRPRRLLSTAITPTSSSPMPFGCASSSART